MPIPTLVRIDLKNVQGIVASGYTHPVSRHLLFHFGSADGARDFLRELPPVTTASDWGENKPERLVNVALSWTGLQATGVLSAEVLANFPEVFRTGPSAEQLGDAGASGRWWNGVPTADLHCLVSLHALTDAALDELAAQVLSNAAATGTRPLWVRPDGRPLDGRMLSPKRRLHFGYQDGFTEPSIGWADPVMPPDVDFRHFLLGYATDAIQSTPRLLPVNRPGNAEAAAFVADSSYAAFRVMYQDVAAFNRFLADNARRLAPQAALSAADMSELLAAKMLGRWRDGQPLVLSPSRPDPAVSPLADFHYAADDKGEACPFSAHIRVVNPRDQKIDEVRLPVPRLLRRGMAYGPPLKSEADDGVDRGLIGLFLCSSLDVQFEKLMDWINRNNFSPVFEDLRAQDPLLGNRDLPLASKEFLIPTPNGPLRATGLTTFVRPRGTAYFLIPSVRALRQLAGQ